MDLPFPVNKPERYSLGQSLYQSTLGKLMISLSDRAENMVRNEVQRVYHGRVGGLSIFFEQVLRNYFQDTDGKAKTSKTRNGRN